MVHHNYFGHLSRVRASRSFHWIGEVLFRQSGRRPHAAVAVNGWMGSFPHRAILLSREFRYIGISHVCGRLGGRRVTVWVGQLGRH